MKLLGTEEFKNVKQIVAGGKESGENYRGESEKGAGQN